MKEALRKIREATLATRKNPTPENARALKRAADDLTRQSDLKVAAAGKRKAKLK
jgi:hypothetical protein